MGCRIRAYDWATTSLGEPERWPQSLKTAVSLMLRARQPVFIGWGRDYISLYNDGYVPICGVKHPWALGRPMHEVWADVWDDLEPLNAAVMRGESFSFENRAFELQGRESPGTSYFNFSYTPLLDDEGGVGGIFCSALETTASVTLAARRETDLAHQLELFRQAPGFIAVMRGPQHVFEFVNEAHVDLFRSADWLGKPVRQAFPDIAGQGFYELLDRVYSTGERVVVQAAPARYRPAPDAAEVIRYLDFIYAPIRTADGEISGVFCEGHEVTDGIAARNEQIAQQHELEALAESLADINRRQSEFLATLAHELRNPLAPILTSLELMRVAGADSATLERTREIATRQVHALVRLVDDLLDMARITGGKLELRCEPVDLRDAIASGLETSRPAIEQGQHTLVVDLPPDAVLVRADSVRIAQVVSNLLNNAARFTPRRGRIGVRVWSEGNEACVQISDSGIGIEPQDLHGIFGMFMQVRRDMPSGQPGLGIGLALVRRLVEMHGGSVHAASEGRGRGAVFCLRLPLLVGELPVPSSAAAAPTTQRALSIVVVDDNKDAAETLAMLLEQYGCVVRTANEGHSGLEAIIECTPDVAFVDIGMPGMDGYELARQVRAARGANSTHLIALTGWGSTDDRERSRAAGFDDHLTKPADPVAVEQLLSTIERDRMRSETSA